jgi:hypothetical protein
MIVTFKQKMGYGAKESSACRSSHKRRAEG